MSELFESVSSPNCNLPVDYFDDEEVEEESKIGGWEDTWLFEEYERRVRNGQDFVIIIAAKNGERGVGKTTLAVHLCFLMDRTDDGWNINKAAIDVDELLNLYANVNKGSSILGDEVQKMADSRRGMKKESVEFTKAMSMTRFREPYQIFTLPDTASLDKRIKKMAHVYILCDDKDVGTAKVYEFWNNDFDDSAPKTRFKETISFEPLDDNEEYQKLEDYKATSYEKLLEEYLSGYSEEDNKDKKEEITRENAKELAIQYRKNGMSYSEIREELPDSPFSDSGEWSKSTLSNWLSDIEKDN